MKHRETFWRGTIKELIQPSQGIIIAVPDPDLEIRGEGGGGGGGGNKNNFKN